MLSLKAPLLISIKIVFGIWIRFGLSMELNDTLRGSNNGTTATNCTTDFSYQCLDDHDIQITCKEEENITELTFTHNRLEKVPVFPKLPYLLKLDLSYNRLRFIGKDNFASVTYLQKIDLSSNFILKIHPEAFDLLRSLEELHLGYNSLGPLDVSNLFKNHNHLILVNLDGNSDLCLKNFKENMSFIKWTSSGKKSVACENQFFTSTVNGYTTLENHEAIMTEITTEGIWSSLFSSMVEGDSPTTVPNSSSVTSQNDGPTDSQVKGDKKTINFKDLFYPFSPITLAVITGLTLNIITLILYLHMNWRVKISIMRRPCH